MSRESARQRKGEWNEEYLKFFDKPVNVRETETRIVSNGEGRFQGGGGSVSGRGSTIEKTPPQQKHPPTQQHTHTPPHHPQTPANPKTPPHPTPTCFFFLVWLPKPKRTPPPPKTPTPKPPPKYPPTPPLPTHPPPPTPRQKPPPQTPLTKTKKNLVGFWGLGGVWVLWGLWCGFCLGGLWGVFPQHTQRRIVFCFCLVLFWEFLCFFLVWLFFLYFWEGFFCFFDFLLGFLICGVFGGCVFFCGVCLFLGWWCGCDWGLGPRPPSPPPLVVGVLSYPPPHEGRGG